MAQRAAQQRVIAGVELDLVDAAAVAVVRVQHRRVGVGPAGMGLQRGRAGLGAQASSADVSRPGACTRKASRSGRLTRNRLTPV